MQVDHIEPHWHTLTETQAQKAKLNKGSHDISNLNPSCSRCNKWKSTYSLEQFRKVVQTSLDRLERDTPNFRLAKDYGLLIIKDNPVIRSIAGERNISVSAPRGRKIVTINLHNTNPEIFTYDNILISKTGYTNPAGRCVLMLVEKGKELYGLVVLGQKNVRDRSRLVKELLQVTSEKVVL